MDIELSKNYIHGQKEGPTQNFLRRHLPIAYNETLRMKPLIPYDDALKIVEYLADINKRGFLLLEKILPSIFLDTKCKYTFDPMHIVREGAARVSSHEIEDDEGIIL